MYKPCFLKPYFSKATSLIISGMRLVVLPFSGWKVETILKIFILEEQIKLITEIDLCKT